MAELVSIVYKPGEETAEAAGYARAPLAEAHLVAGHGIAGDAKGGGPSRHLNVMSAGVLAALAREGFRTEPGAMGEQLVVAGLTVEALPPGTRLRLGADACVELTEPRTGCAKFERHQGRRREEVAGRLGMMARVVGGGVVRPGDPVQVEPAAPAA